MRPAILFLVLAACGVIGCNKPGGDPSDERVPGSVAGTGVTAGDSTPSTHSQTEGSGVSPSGTATDTSNQEGNESSAANEAGQ
jgi:hypothetical protein